MKAHHARKNSHLSESGIVVDPLAAPLVPPRTHQIPRGRSFVRDREFGAGQVNQQQVAKSLLRRAGHR